MDKDKRTPTSPTGSRGSRDSGYYSSRPSSSSSQDAKRIEEKNAAISKAFYRLIHGPFYDNPENWVEDLQKFKKEVERIENDFIGKFINSKIVFSWKSLDTIIARDNKEPLNQITIKGRTVDYSAEALRSIIRSEAIFQKGMLEKLLAEYEQEYEEDSISLAHILKSKDSFKGNILHSFTNKVANKTRLGRRIDSLWEIYRQIKEKVPEIANETDEFGETPLDIIEREGITFGEQIY